LLDAGWAGETEIAQRDCRGHEHFHVTRAEVAALVGDEDAVWIDYSDKKSCSGVIRDLARRCGPNLSLKVGAYLALLLYRERAKKLEGIGAHILGEFRRG
jgi:hypothetical protein